jgi:hypothetical protein
LRRRFVDSRPIIYLTTVAETTACCRRRCRCLTHIAPAVGINLRTLTSLPLTSRGRDGPPASARYSAVCYGRRLCTHIRKSYNTPRDTSSCCIRRRASTRSDAPAARCNIRCTAHTFARAQMRSTCVALLGTSSGCRKTILMFDRLRRRHVFRLKKRNETDADAAFHKHTPCTILTREMRNVQTSEAICVAMVTKGYHIVSSANRRRL